ncbi:hypothetical protein Ciccas_006732 [Cichlidogyrus casuarinus]|uniref:Uncharacterized protein n=1 Tax=Cichlidogyrus casuarinus TaxID=1844966 RepID=A0ABD2Q4Z8_9PLAT
MSLGFIHPKVSSKLASAFEFAVLSCANYLFQVSLFHPYEVSSTVMAVQGSDLSLATVDSPRGFSDWRLCRDYLKLTGQSMRGSSPIFRYSHIRPNHRHLINAVTFTQ